MKFGKPMSLSGSKYHSEELGSVFYTGKSKNVVQIAKCPQFYMLSLSFTWFSSFYTVGNVLKPFQNDSPRPEGKL